jgi:hypothetical protein
MGVAVRLGKVVSGNATQELNGIGHIQLAREALQARTVRAISHDAVLQSRKTGKKGRESSENQIDAFAAHNTTHS